LGADAPSVLQPEVNTKDLLCLLDESPKDISTYLKYNRHKSHRRTREHAPSPALARNRPSPDENLSALTHDLWPSSLLQFHSTQLLFGLGLGAHHDEIRVWVLNRTRTYTHSLDGILTWNMGNHALDRGSSCPAWCLKPLYSSVPAFVSS
jgi:hypothetical protein